MEGLPKGLGGRRIRFGDYELDPQSGKLFREGRSVKIQPQPLRVLAVLVERPGEIVSRDELRTRVWGDATFVEFDQGLNYCVRQVRLALRDGASDPRYIETLPKQGYRFIAGIEASNIEEPHAVAEDQSDPETSHPRRLTAPRPDPPILPPAEPARSPVAWQIRAGVCAALAIVGVAVYASLRVHPAGVTFTQLTDFTDSAMGPVLSPDGRMLAFIRGSSSFVTADEIYVKVLPNGEARRLIDDPRLKYNLAFSPDGSQIAYTVLEDPAWATYAVSVLGGDSHLLLKNAAGLTWLDHNQLLFSRTRSGQHMGIVTGTISPREDFRELYYPTHERAMAHYSFASPDRKSALVVEMDEQGRWAPCLLISLEGPSPAKAIGPHGACVSAAFSPDGSWMFFTAVVEGQEHLWRQRFPNGMPEQITFGPTEEEGVAVEHDGRSVITSMGMEESAIWIHDGHGERSLSSEGEIPSVSGVPGLDAGISPPSFGADDKALYYLLRHRTAGSGPELWRLTVESGKSEAVFPGIDMLAYDVSPDGKQVTYATAAAHGVKSQLWLAPIDRSSPARRIANSGERSPHFGSRGQILFQRTEGNFNYLEQMDRDGSGRSKVVPFPIGDVLGISPGRRWVMAMVPRQDGSGVAPMAIPVDGGAPRLLCPIYCIPKWSSNGNFLFITVERPSRTGPGRTLAIPVGPGESLPEFPAGGIKPLADPSVVPGAQSVPRADFVPGRDPSHFAFVNTAVHRNLYRISLP